MSVDIGTRWRPAALTLLAALASYGVWWLVGRLIAETVLEDFGTVLKFAAVFVTLTLVERLYSRFDGPAGH